jgi:hypothetical protein
VKNEQLKYYVCTTPQADNVNNFGKKVQEKLRKTMLMVMKVFFIAGTFCFVILLPIDSMFFLMP